MTSTEIRQSFLDFFAARGHRIVPSAPVIPHGDPTLLFTNAGMNQFKDVFLGQGTRDYTRAADTQKCIRASGKHNDLEDVGVDTYHHTFFEMLGNWSFGDYYKKEALAWSWELLTDVWKLPKERLHATVFRTDDESYEIWKQFLPESHIHRCDEKDNFWEMGETGPCGPCSEIHFDRTPDLSGGPLVNAGVPEVIEVWNNVFIQYNRKSDRSLEPLAQRHVDTGMGFERITAVLQGKSSNYDTDIFQPLIALTEQLCGRTYQQALDHPDGIAMRVIADHVRTLSFAIADGAIPGNEGRGYVLRRILRRGARYARNLGLHEPVLYKHVGVLCDTMGDAFPELRTQRAIIERVMKAEEESFLATLDRGLVRFAEVQKSLTDVVENAAKAILAIQPTDAQIEERSVKLLSLQKAMESSFDQLAKNFQVFVKPAMEKSLADLAEQLYPIVSNAGANIGQALKSAMEKSGLLQVPGDKAFELYDTYGFPIDLTQLLARESSLKVDLDEYERLLEEQRTRSRSARKSHASEATTSTSNLKSHFDGYDHEETTAQILAIDGCDVVLSTTPLYATMGGQVHDEGTLVVGGEEYSVVDVRKDRDAIVHVTDRPIVANVGDDAVVRLDLPRRAVISQQHSATHLLHEALRRVLGTHVKQAGSLVAPDELRFDFSHFERVTSDEIRQIEAMVNEKIAADFEVRSEELSIDEARAIPNVKMFFADKYGDNVRVVTIDPEFSVEFCGGTHVKRTSDLEGFKVLHESGIASGVRRIQALAGRALDAYATDLANVVGEELTVSLEKSQQIATLHKQLKELGSDVERTSLPSHTQAEITAISGTVAERVSRLMALRDTMQLTQAQQDKELRRLEQQLASLRTGALKNVLPAIIESARSVDGVRIATGEVRVESTDQLKELGDELRSALKTQGIGVLASVADDKVQLVCVVTDDLIPRYKAGAIVGALAKELGGGGGGKNHLATAGGRDVARLGMVLDAAPSIISKLNS